MRKNNFTKIVMVVMSFVLVLGIIPFGVFSTNEVEAYTFPDSIEVKRELISGVAKHKRIYERRKEAEEFFGDSQLGESSEEITAYSAEGFLLFCIEKGILEYIYPYVKRGQAYAYSDDSELKDAIAYLGLATGNYTFEQFKKKASSDKNLNVSMQLFIWSALKQIEIEDTSSWSYRAYQDFLKNRSKLKSNLEYDFSNIKIGQNTIKNTGSGGFSSVINSNPTILFSHSGVKGSIDPVSGDISMNVSKDAIRSGFSVKFSQPRIDGAEIYAQEYMGRDDLFQRMVILDGKLGNFKDYVYQVDSVPANYIEILKVDQDGGEILGKPVGFNLLDSDKNPLKLSLIDSYTYEIFQDGDRTQIWTNPDTSKLYIEGFEIGKTYYLEEISTPKPYISDGKLIEIAFNESQQIEVANKVQKGSISIEKTGQILKSIDVDENGITNLILEEGLLADSIWKITAGEDIKDEITGKIVFEKGQTVEELTTRNDGPVYSKDLPLGRYLVEEISAPDQYVLDTNQYTINLLYDGDQGELVSDSFDLFNERKDLTISFIKEFADNNLLESNISSKFGLYLAEDYIENEITIPKDSLLDVVELKEIDENNQTILTFKKIPIDGKFYVKELQVSNQFILDNNPYDVGFDFSQSSVKDNIIQVEDIILNELTKFSINLVKLDNSLDDQLDLPLEGAIFKLVSLNLEGMETEIGVFTSDENGKIEILGLPLGKYYLQEIKAPSGYMIDERKIEIDGTNFKNGQVISLELYNKKIPEISTEFASINGDKQVIRSENVELIDTISYKNFDVGKTYSAKLTLIDKSTGEVLTYNGNELTTSIDFEVSKSDGNVEVPININLVDFKGFHIVAYEKVYLDGELIASHEDIGSQSQTIEVIEYEETEAETEEETQKETEEETQKETEEERKITTSGNNPNTGDNGVVVFLLLAMVAGIILTILTLFKKRLYSYFK